MIEVDLAEVYGEPTGSLLMQVEWPSGVEGFRAIQRVGFQSMRIPGLPERIDVGRVMVLRIASGPVVTQQTTVVQRPGAPLIWDKTMYQPVFVGAGVPLTVGHVAAFLPIDSDAKPAFSGWREAIYSAVGLLATLLDDRIGQSEIFDDYVVFDEDGKFAGFADYAASIRNYLPFEVAVTEKDAVATLERLEIPANVLVAARWYLRATLVGPAADGIPYLWTSLEALTQAEGRDVVRKVEVALRLAGENPDKLEPSLGRLFGERARIVHFGETDPTELMVEGWYLLERVARTLIRTAIGLGTDWPVQPGDLEALPVDVRTVWTETPHQSEWHEPP